MNKENHIEILLFLTELKAANGIEEKYKRELNRHISFLKKLVNNNEGIKKENSKYKLKLSQIINWIVMYFTSS